MDNPHRNLKAAADIRQTLKALQESLPLLAAKGFAKEAHRIGEIVKDTQKTMDRIAVDTDGEFISRH
ncbi:hypothetical protein LOY37_15620 [Pseudomonas sp. B21-012]|uniref:hypothetical protein n=1 Tax=unclassified Pseudomonas TaxID=196821 RepID=UPI001BCEAF5A|nr:MULTISPECIES: hypothetical protein [unclassified Pseudomonas]QVM98879.1 hypothetical protein JYG36_12185 [Pseudomonas sp. SORT22]UVL59539.1 hypothetical protein LOY54_15935 [Pseudomonas sp. B21-032]UVM53800.1 hypothetical protein LOY37_15620 [Pseudomonas sp. B21-012]